VGLRHFDRGVASEETSHGENAGVDGAAIAADEIEALVMPQTRRDADGRPVRIARALK
jgi:hypothetical protein